MSESKVNVAAEVEKEASEDVKVIEFQNETYKMKRKFKRLRFLRLITTDPAEALKLAFPDEEYERLEEVDLDESGLEELMSVIAGQLAGGQENSSASRS